VQLINILEKLLHLSKNEARVYAALLQNPNASVNLLSTELNLPRSRVYQLLSSLAAHDLLQRKVGSSQYTVIPPSEALDGFLERMEDEHKQHKEGILELRGLLKGVWKEAIVEDLTPGVELIPFIYIEEIFLKSIATAQSKLYIAASSGIPVIDWSKSGNALSEGYHLDLEVRYLVNDRKVFDRLQNAFGKFSPFSSVNFDLRYSGDLSSSFVLIDEELYLMFFGKDQQSTMVLHTSSSELKSTFYWLFERLWSENN